MKNLFSITLALILFSAVTMVAQTDYKAHADGWMVNFEEAKQVSEKSGKPIMANFTGSDWCGWCKRLKREVFDTPEFKSWADKNVVLLELDYPRRFKVPTEIQQQNQGLQRAFQVRGYPSIWIFKVSEDSTTAKSVIDAYGKTGYVRGGTSEFINTAEEIIAHGNPVNP